MRDIQFLPKDQKAKTRGSKTCKNSSSGTKDADNDAANAPSSPPKPKAGMVRRLPYSLLTEGSTASGEDIEPESSSMSTPKGGNSHQ